MGGAGAMTHGTRAMTGGVRAVMCNATAKGTSGVKGGYRVRKRQGGARAVEGLCERVMPEGGGGT